jgi:acetate kinase
MNEVIAVFNAGSTSLKFGAYAVDATESLSLRCEGQIDSMQGDPHFIVKDAAGKGWAPTSGARVTRSTTG